MTTVTMPQMQAPVSRVRFAMPSTFAAFRSPRPVGADPRVCPDFLRRDQPTTPAETYAYRLGIACAGRKKANPSLIVVNPYTPLQTALRGWFERGFNQGAEDGKL